MNVEKTKIQFMASQKDKISREFIQGVLSDEFGNIACHASIDHIEARRIFPGQECQIFAIELDKGAFQGEDPVEASNQLVHDMLQVFKLKGLNVAPSAFIAQKFGLFYRRERLTTNFEEAKTKSSYSRESFLHDGYPIEPLYKDKPPIVIP